MLKRITASSYIVLISLASAFSLFFAQYNNLYIQITSAVFTFCFNVFLLNIFLLCFSKFKRTIKYLTAFLTIASVILLYTQIARGFVLTPSVLYAILVTNKEEMRALFSIIDIVITLGLIFATCLPLIKKQNLEFKFNYKFTLICFAIALILSICLTPRQINAKAADCINRKKKTHKFYYLTNFENSVPFSFFNSFAKFAFKLLQTKNNEPIVVNYTKQSQDNDLIVVYLIGETLRHDRLQINSYNKNTTPFLLLAEKSGRLINFKQASKSCDILTSLSTPCMLSGNQDGTQFDLFKIFNMAGFKSFFYSVHSVRNVKPIMHSIYTHADYKFNAFYNDIEIPTKISEIAKSNQHQKKFITIQMLGSHNIGVENLLEKEYKERIFTPYCQSLEISDCFKHEGEEKMQNSYNNTVVFTDIVIGKIFDALKDKNAILFFSSDHGQFLGEEGKFGHGIVNPDGTKPEKQYDVPIFVWMSDKYKANHLPLYKSISHTALTQKSSNHLELYNSIIACNDINVKNLDTAKNYCSNKLEK
jgi:KDO II ethanolaminephosphotransferase